MFPRAAGAVTNKGILTAAGSILTMEFRHQVWINLVANKGTPRSGAYDALLSINGTYTLPGTLNFTFYWPDSFLRYRWLHHRRPRLQSCLPP